MAQQWLRDAVAGGASGPEAFAAGLLVRAEQDLAEKHRRRWRAAWDEASRKKLRLVGPMRGPTARAASG